MTWTVLTYPFGSQLTSTKMTQLQDNLTALANGDSGAPKLQTAAYDTGSVDTDALGSDSVNNLKIIADAVRGDEIASGSVGQSELNSAFASQSTSVPAATSGSIDNLFGAATISPTGSAYTISYFLGGSTDHKWLSLKAHTGTYSAVVGISNSKTAGATTAYLYSWYSQASPPYDLGNGDIPVFIYLLIAKAGNTAGIPAGTILATSTAVDPSWAYNGPDKINTNSILTMPDKTVIEMVKDIPWTKEEARQDFGKMQENLAAHLNPKYIPENIDMARKLRNMPNVPHPFQDDVNLEYGTVVMVDPQSDLAIAMSELVHDGDGESIQDILDHKSLVIGSDQISGLITPPGVIGVSASL